jgi:hypothetical protein
MVNESIGRHFRASAMVGFLCWLGTLRTLPDSSLWGIQALLLLAPFTIVPLGMSLLVRQLHASTRVGEWKALSWLQLPAAGCLAAGFYFPDWNVPLSVPWLGWTCWLFGLRILDWLQNKEWSIDCIADLASVSYLPVGASWVLIHHTNWQPLEFSETIVVLTAVHFHYAGFAFPLLAGRIAESAGSPWGIGASVVAILAVPLVALGITLTQLTGSHLLEGFSAWLLALTGMVLAWQQASIPQKGLTKIMLIASSVSLAFALGWSAVYAGARMGIWSGVDIPFMTRWHGVVNAVGFALVGLIGWNRSEELR